MSQVVEITTESLFLASLTKNLMKEEAIVVIPAKLETLSRSLHALLGNKNNLIEKLFRLFLINIQLDPIITGLESIE